MGKFIKEYKFDWYNRFNIKLVESKGSSEFYNNKEYQSPEHACWAEVFTEESREFVLDKVIPETLELYEKFCFLNNGECPEYLTKMLFDGVINDFDTHALRTLLRERDTEATIYAKIIKKMEEMRGKHSALFQRRIPWELSLDLETKKLYIYGRFNVVII